MEFTTLYSGSSGNAIFVKGGNTRVLIDIGQSARKTVLALNEIGENPYDIHGIFVTHEHSDHIKGIDVFARRYNIPVFASPETWKRLPFAHSLPSALKYVYRQNMEVCDLEADFFKLHHDAVQPVGIILRHEGKSIGVVTDTGCLTTKIIGMLHGADALIIEANHNLDMLYNGPYPYHLKKRVAGQQGHLSNQQAAYGISQMVTEKTKAVLLSHLSETNNSPSVALKEVKSRAANLGTGFLRNILVAPRYSPHPVIRL